MSLRQEIESAKRLDNLKHAKVVELLKESLPDSHGLRQEAVKQLDRWERLAETVETLGCGTAHGFLMQQYPGIEETKLFQDLHPEYEPTTESTPTSP